MSDIIDISQQVADCPLCDREWKQGKLAELGVWDGLALDPEDDEERNGYAAYVGCGCGFTGPSRTTSAGAIAAWNQNAQLVRTRIEKGSAIESNFVRDDLIALGFIQKEAA